MSGFRNYSRYAVNHRDAVNRFKNVGLTGSTLLSVMFRKGARGVKLWILLAAALGYSGLAQAQEQVEKLTNKDGTVYNQVSITTIKPGKVSFISKEGAITLPIESLIIPDQEVIAFVVKHREEEKAAKLATKAKAEMWAPVLARLNRDYPNSETNAEAIVTVCNLGEELVRQKVATQEMVDTWNRLVIEQKIRVGMPAAFVLLSWGAPTTVHHSSHGPEQWVYRNSSQPQYVYVQNSIVTAWND